MFFYSDIDPETYISMPSNIQLLYVVAEIWTHVFTDS